MFKFVTITNTKYLESYDKGELEEICSWDEQELNTEFDEDWEWDADENVYQRSALVDGGECPLDDSELEQWKLGKFEAYRIYSRAEVYNLIRVTDAIGENDE